MKRVLVLCSGYPSEDNHYNCTWAHIRNRYYVEAGFSVDVYVTLSGVSYTIDGVNVVDRKTLYKNIKEGVYAVVLSHSPNIRNHLPILRTLKDIKIILFMHGSESMYVNSDYPKPYHYMRDSLVRRMIRDLYDFSKMKVMSRYIRGNSDRIHLVFVSAWMKEMFSKNMFCPERFKVGYSIINNTLNKAFFSESFDPDEKKEADFVTLRRLDDSKYAIDLVVRLAEANPRYKFHVYGKGRYFCHYPKPANVTVFNTHVKQDEIPGLLSKYRAAIMPTRCDAQGVMVCEMATFGMPVITSNISVNQEMFEDFENVFLLDDDEFSLPLNVDQLQHAQRRNIDRFSTANTLEKEISMIKGSLSICD